MRRRNLGAGMVTSRSISHLPDVELVHRAQRGHDAALDVLIGRYRRFVRAKSRGYFLAGGDADDLEQEALLGLCKAVRDYRSERCGSFRPFVELCVTRQIMTAIKVANRRKHQPLNWSVAIANVRCGEAGPEVAPEDRLVDDGTLEPAEQVVERQSAAEIRATLSAVLSDLELQVLGLYVDGWSYGEIGEALGRESKAIDNALQRIRRKLEGSVGEALARDIAGIGRRRVSSVHHLHQPAGA